MPTFSMSSATAAFLRRSGLIVFHKNPVTGQITSYRHNSISSLAEIKQYFGYQFDNNSGQLVTLPNKFLGFATQPDLTDVVPPTPPANLRTAIPLSKLYYRYWIGNSLSDEIKDTNANAGVKPLAIAAGYPGHEWGRSMTPGAPPEWLYDQSVAFTQPPYGDFREAFAGWDFDGFVYQPFTRPVDNETLYFSKFTDHIVAGPSGSDTQPFLYMHWMNKRSNGVNDAAYWKQIWDTDYRTIPYFYQTRNFFEDLIVSVRQSETRIKPALMIPVGEVLYQLNELAMNGQLPEIASSFDFYEDDIHLNDTGSYITALTHYATIYFRSPVGLPVPSGFGSISSQLVSIIQQVVWDVVSNYRYSAIAV